MALLAAFPEHGVIPCHRLLRARARVRPGGAAAGPVQPAAASAGAVRSGPAGDGAAVGVAAVAADAGAVPAACAVAGPEEGRNVPDPTRLAAHPRCPEASRIRGGGFALGGCIHVGVPGTVPG